MKTKQEFKTFYDTELLPKLESIDKERKQAKNKNFITTIVFILIFIALWVIGFLINKAVYGVPFDNKSANVPLIITIILFIMGIGVYFYYLKRNKSAFVDSFKNNIITPIIEFIHKDLKYSSKDFIKKNEFIESGIFTNTPDRYYGDDLIYGTIDKTEIAFSEVHASYKTSAGDDDKERWVDIFNGLFFKADFNKNFNGKYFVLPDFAERKFGRIGTAFQKLNKHYGELVQLEDIEFEKEFAVYGSDQIEARYILSSSIMQRLLDFKRKTNKDIMLSFVNSNIYIAIPYKGNLFDPRYHRSVINEKQTMSYFNDLELAISIVEDLNLNNRIWTKQ
ncbi:MAG: DUF3137 domain-containing protein [Bacteroidetes bacterium]|nr:DUF3137 domain-containing protein [Bacteroidota bacterium]